MPGAISGLLGGGAKTASKASGAIQKFIEMAIGELRPFADAGIEQLGNLTEGTTAGGLDTRLAEIFDTDVFGSLVGERTRGVQGQLAAGGLTRSGTALEEIAQIGPDLALQLEQLLTGRSQFLSGQGVGAAGDISNLLVQQGEAASSGILAKGQAKAGQISNIGSIVSTAAGIFFSDRRLKINAVQVSNIMGLPVYQWDWIPEAKGTLIEHGPTMGFMADEVRERYPHLVGEHCGWLFVDLDGVLDTLTDELLEERKCLH